MDFFQGNTPPNFVSFRLESVLKENPDQPTTQASNPAVPESTATGSEGFSHDRTITQITQFQGSAKIDSPALSQDSDADVNAYAETIV